MTSDDIDLTVAHLLGYTNVIINSRGELYAVTPDSAPERTHLRRFTRSLDAVHGAEQVIAARGLLSTYRAALHDRFADQPDPHGSALICGPLDRAATLASLPQS